MAGPSKIGSIKNFQDGVKGRGGAFIKDIPQDGSMTVRFLSDPEEWVEFEQWYDKPTNTFGVIMDDNSVVPTTANVSRKYLANALDTNTGEVIPLRMPRTLAEDLNAYYEKYGTLTDRDYELTRSGKSLNTRYRAVPDAVFDRPLSRYTPVDLLKAIEDNEAFAARKRNGQTTVANTPTPTAPVTRRLVRRVETQGHGDSTSTMDARGVPLEREEPQPIEVPPVQDQAPDTFTTENPDKDTTEYVTPEQIQAMTLGELKFVARDNGLDTAGMTREAIVAALTGIPESEQEPF